MKELIERLREDYCSCIDGYKSRGMTDPQCSSCDSKDWRGECADALERLTAENTQLENNNVWQATKIVEHLDTIEHLTAERDALRADAERYRWLQDADENQWSTLMYETTDWQDAYIDAAMGEKHD